MMGKEGHFMQIRSVGATGSKRQKCVNSETTPYIN